MAYWNHFFGRGIIDPEDDMRVTNPPSNPELLDTLQRWAADELRSLNGQIEFVLREAILRAGRQKGGAAGKQLPR